MIGDEVRLYSIRVSAVSAKVFSTRHNPNYDVFLRTMLIRVNSRLFPFRKTLVFD